MSFCVSEIKMPKKRVECLRTRRVQYGCDEVLNGPPLECTLPVLLVDAPDNEKSDDDECIPNWVWLVGLVCGCINKVVGFCSLCKPCQEHRNTGGVAS